MSFSEFTRANPFIDLGLKLKINRIIEEHSTTPESTKACMAFYELIQDFNKEDSAEIEYLKGRDLDVSQDIHDLYRVVEGFKEEIRDKKKEDNFRLDKMAATLGAISTTVDKIYETERILKLLAESLSNLLSCMERKTTLNMRDKEILPSNVTINLRKVIEFAKGTPDEPKN